MSLIDRILALLRGADRRSATRATPGLRTRGLPDSSNHASSMHLHWLLPAGSSQAGPVVEVAATLEVLVPPAVDRLYFWALQASFIDAAGIQHGAAHLGLQWHPDHPGNTAANWGGYHHGGGELSGTGSPLPSARGNPNTRDFHWDPSRPYRLTIRRGDDGLWAGLVDDIEIRRLQVPGAKLDRVMVWSEVFARCDEPSVTVRWSGFQARTESGAVIRPDRLRVTFQSHAQGGCDNTNVRATAAGVLQVTNVPRDLRPEAVIPAGPVGP